MLNKVGKFYLHSVLRQFYLVCMQKRSTNPMTAKITAIPILAAVCIVSQNWSSAVLQMHTNLMGSRCHREQKHQ